MARTRSQSQGLRSRDRQTTGNRRGRIGHRACRAAREQTRRRTWQAAWALAARSRAWRENAAALAEKGSQSWSRAYRVMPACGHTGEPPGAVWARPRSPAGPAGLTPSNAPPSQPCRRSVAQYPDAGCSSCGVSLGILLSPLPRRTSMNGPLLDMHMNGMDCGAGARQVVLVKTRIQNPRTRAGTPAHECEAVKAKW